MAAVRIFSLAVVMISATNEPLKLSMHILVKGKRKVILLQARCGPEGG